MGTVKQINIKNRTYYFYNDIIDLENFDSSLLKIDKKSYKDIGIYSIGYITIKKMDDCKIIRSVNPSYLLVNQENGYVKYLIFDATYEIKELIKQYNDVWGGISDKIKEVSSGERNYEKDYMKIISNSDYDLPLNKPLKFRLMTINIRSVASFSRWYFV